MTRIKDSSKRKFQILAASSLALLAIGCGKQRQGQYQGMEAVRVNDPAMNAYMNGGTGSSNTIRAQVSIFIQETNSELVSGTWSSKSASGTFTGYLNSDQITNVVLTRRASSSASALTNSQYPVAVAYSTADGTIAAICSGEYTGSLRFDGDHMTGTLAPTNNANPYAQQFGQCLQIDVDAAKITN